MIFLKKIKKETYDSIYDTAKQGLSKEERSLNNLVRLRQIGLKVYLKKKLKIMILF